MISVLFVVWFGIVRCYFSLLLLPHSHILRIQSKWSAILLPWFACKQLETDQQQIFHLQKPCRIRGIHGGTVHLGSTKIMDSIFQTKENIIHMEILPRWIYFVDQVIQIQQVQEYISCNHIMVRGLVHLMDEYQVAKQAWVVQKLPNFGKLPNWQIMPTSTSKMKMTWVNSKSCSTNLAKLWRYRLFQG